MSDFVDILEKQIDEERKSRPKTPITESDSKKMIQKKKMIPLRADMEVQNAEPTESDSPETKGGALWGTRPPSPPPPEPGAKGGALWGPPLAETSPASPEPPKPEPKGGALWGPPPDADSIPQPPPQPREGKCLMDLIMEEPPQKQLKPTLFTYFDHLMANGEV